MSPIQGTPAGQVSALSEAFVRTQERMPKPLAIAAALIVASLPDAAAARSPEAREPPAADLEPRANDEWTHPASGERQLQLVLALGSAATDRPTSSSPSVNVGLLYLGAIAGSVAFVGSGVGYYRAISRATGSAVVGGGSAELLLTPRLVSVPLALRLTLGPRIRAALEPALVVGWVTAALRRTSGNLLDTSSSPGVGFQLGAGLEAQLSDRFGLALQAGFRALKPSLTVRPLARAGEPLGSQSESVNVDLTGIFWSAGLVIQL